MKLALVLLSVLLCLAVDNASASNAQDLADQYNEYMSYDGIYYTKISPSQSQLPHPADAAGVTSYMLNVHGVHVESATECPSPTFLSYLDCPGVNPNSWRACKCVYSFTAWVNNGR